VFLLQVLAASSLMAVYLMWANGAVAWTRMPGQNLQRIWLLALVIAGGIAIYFVATWAAGLKLQQFLRRHGPGGSV
jgi:putative peptidoglycan lipid II flippase